MFVKMVHNFEHCTGITGGSTGLHLCKQMIHLIRLGLGDVVSMVPRGGG